MASRPKDVPIEPTPFLIYSGDRKFSSLEKTDHILVTVRIEDDLDYWYLPQFDLEVRDTTDEVVETMFRQLLQLYAALRKLPADYRTEIEDEQIRLIEDLFLPWLAVSYGEDPGSFQPPTAAADIGTTLTAARA